MKMTKTKTARGFKLVQFSDSYGELCDIQESSNVEPHIWLGTHNPNPQILSKHTKEGGTGWVPYEIPDEVLISHRMTLDRKQSFLLGLKLMFYGMTGRI